MDIDKRIEQAIKHTEILRAPKQSLYTFGTTNIYYYLVTEPAYSELIKNITETVVREGRVIAERPKIVTPYYLSQLEGFSTEARRYFEALVEEHGERGIHGFCHGFVSRLIEWYRSFHGIINVILVVFVKNSLDKSRGTEIQVSFVFQNLVAYV